MLLFVLSTFCFSSGTLGGFLLHGHEIHIENNHTHFHHINDHIENNHAHFHHINDHNSLGDESHNEDHDLGDSDHHDTENILYIDFLLTNQSRAIKPYADSYKYLRFSFLRTYLHSLFNVTSRTTYSSNITRFPTTNLYQIYSSFLI